MKRLSPAWVMALAAIATPASAAPLYATLDRHGQLQISSAPTEGARAFDPHRPYQRPAAPPPSAPRTATRTAPRAASRWNAMIEQVAAEHGVDARLLHAIIRVESAYNAQARSHAGALGLMQVIPATGKRFGADDLLDPLQNLRAGTAYLVWLKRRFDGDLELMLAAYNAGEGAVQRHGNRIPPFKETRQYVTKVTALYRAGLH